MQPDDPVSRLIKKLKAPWNSGMKNDYGPYVREGADPIEMICMVCDDNAACMKPIKAKRRPLGEYDVHFSMKYCGMCHTDIHFTRNDLGFAAYPMCPGHELAGIVTSVGSKVTTFEVGSTLVPAALSTAAFTASIAFLETNSTVSRVLL